MSNLLEVAKHALEAMEDAMYRADTHEFYDAKEALRQAIEQAEQQEPVAWAAQNAVGHVFLRQKKPHPLFNPVPLYTTPPQRKPLTDEMVKRMKEVCDSMEMRGAFADGWLSAERAHGIGEQHE